MALAARARDPFTTIDSVDLLLRSPEEIAVGVEELLRLMGQHPYSATDMFAVQFAVTECLNLAFSSLGLDLPLRIHAQIALQFIRIRIQLVQRRIDPSLATTEKATAHVSLPQSLSPSGLRLISIYMTSVDFSAAGDALILYRARGQGAPLATPPRGYDFQI